jgi:hypothetical protein
MLFNFFSFFFYAVRSFTSCGPEIISNFKHNIFLRIAIDRPNPQSILIDDFVSFIRVDFLNHIRTIPFGEELVAYVF